MNKKIITLILALFLTLGITLSLSSCLSSLDAIVGGLVGSGFGEEDDTIGGKPESDNGGGETEKPSGESGSTSGDTNGSGSESGDNTEGDDGLTFYPGSGEESLENLKPYNKTLLTSVVINAHFGPSPSASSGVIYEIDKESGDAYIITNYHAVYNSSYGMADVADIYLYGMELSTYAVKATVLGGSATFDIAVLKVTGSEVIKNSYALCAEFADSEKVRVFDTAFVTGNAEGYGMSATAGIVSVTSEKLAMTGADGKPVELRVMRVDAAINEGNSGGGLYNENGELIGIVCAKRVGSGVDNMGYAIPSNLAKNLVKNIIDNCDGDTALQVKRALIGITITAKVIGLVVDPVTGEMWQEEIVEVADVTDSCLIKDEIKIGDKVNSVTIDGVKVDISRVHHLPEHMLNARVGSTVVLNVTRGGETFDLTIVIPDNAITLER